MAVIDLLSIKNASCFSHRALWTLLIAVGFVALTWTLVELSSDSSTSVQTFHTPEKAQGTESQHSSSTDCNSSLVPDDAVIIVKTGANELYEKVPVQLLTSLRCSPHLLFFSDREERLGRHQIHDALDTVSDAIKETSPEFEYYHRLQEYQRTGQDLSSLGQNFSEAAWNLDKFKFVNILEKTWKLQPNHKWYVFIEADTYLIQSNLRTWLQRFDPSKIRYLGSPTQIHGEAFAHGGSGIVLSGAALAQFAAGDEGLAAKYEKFIQSEMLGDYVLMKALQLKDVHLNSVWPVLQGEKPSSIPFGPGLNSNGGRLWCQPLVSMHHVSPYEANLIASFEREFAASADQPLLLKDIYNGMVAKHMTPERDDWHNLSDDVVYSASGQTNDNDRQKLPEEKELSETEHEAHKSFEHCRKVCEEDPKCFQFVHFDQTCGLSYSYRLGSRQQQQQLDSSTAGVRYKSGWLMDRIDRDREEGAVCEELVWVGNGGR